MIPFCRPVTPGGALLGLSLVLSAFAGLLPPGRALAASPDEGWAEFTSFAYEGRDPVFDRAPPGPDEFYNPIVSGFYPDPSICRVGEDYYLVHSSFSYFPGVPIFHSRDLVNWTQIGHVLDRPSQLDLDGLPVSSGIYAPAITWHDGLFYLITTNVRGIGNFYVTAKHPSGPWSEPERLAFDGIDPSFFFDDDGRAYVVHNGPPPDNRPLYDGHRAIWLWEFDRATRTVKNGRIIVNGGVDLRDRPVWVEGPHIFKHDGHYYLTCAEGGTGPNHSQVIFRTRSLAEPFAPGPRNPILTQRDLDPGRRDPVIALGHADLEQTPAGDWWAVFLGIRPYESGRSNIGRETFLLPVRWVDGWPVILEPGEVMPVVVKRPALPAAPRPASPTTGSFAWKDEFDDARLGLPWLFLRTPREQWWSLTTRPGSLLIEPREAPLDSVPRREPRLNGNPSFIARRLQHVNYAASATLAIRPSMLDSDTGLAALQNDTNYFFLGVRVGAGRVREVFLEQRSQADATPRVLFREPLPPSAQMIGLRIEGAGKNHAFSYRASEDGAWQVLAADVDGGLLSTQDAGGFVGATVGMYARLPRRTSPPVAAAPAAVAAALPAGKHLGEIAVTTSPSTPSAPWTPDFAGGALALDSFGGFGPDGPFRNEIEPGAGIMQIVRGNGEVLHGVAFCTDATSAPGEGRKFSLVVYDYGPVSPLNSPAALAQNGVPVVTADFTWRSSFECRRHHFDLSAARLMLARDRYYGFALRFDAAVGPQTILRSVVDALPEARLAFGVPGAFTYDFAGGDRDAHFALYSRRP